MSLKRIVVIGGSAAGPKAAARAKRPRSRCPCHVVAKGPRVVHGLLRLSLLYRWHIR